MGDGFAGELEQMILLAVLRLGDEAYGWSVAEELERVAGRAVSSGALYTTLGRLEEKGYLRSRLDEGGQARGGRPRRYLTVSAAGMAAVRRSRTAMDRLWAGVEPRAGEAR
jgi:DNA-binding PadR family transcriptional regulator